MGDKLDNVPWSNLSHAYGEASDVPDLLRKLASKDSRIRKDAYSMLYSNVFHQGTRWEVTPYVVPFLYDLLDRESTKDKAELIVYLLHLAVGYPEEIGPFGIDPETEFSNMDEDGIITDYGRETYYACVKGQDSLIQCTYSKEQEVRVLAVFALSFFSYDINEHGYSRIQEIAFGSEDERERANAIFALGMIGCQKKVMTSYLNIREVFLREEIKPSLEKIAAACSMVLLDGYSKKDQQIQYLAGIPALFLEENKTFFWCGGSLKGLIGILLSGVNFPYQDLAVETVTGYMTSLNPDESLMVTNSLLKIITISNKGLSFPRQFKEFTAVSQAALRMIAKEGAWKIGGDTFMNYSELLEFYGFEGGYEEFMEFIEDTE